MTATKSILAQLHRLVKTEDNAITSLIVLVFLLAAAHNYDALRHFAFESGVAWSLSFATPILIDTFIAAAVWVSLRNKRYGEPARLAWVIIVAFTGVSIGLNLLHYPQLIGGRAMAVIVPVVVLASSELAKGLVESQRNRNGAAVATAALRSEIERLEREQAQAAQRLAQLDGDFAQRRAQLEAQIAHLEAQRDSAQTPQIDPKTRQMYQIDGLIAAGLSQRAAAEKLGISESTVRNRVANLNGDSLLHRAEVG